MSVKIKNMSSSLISLSCPEVRFHRFIEPSRTVTVDDEVFEELNFDSGFTVLIEQGYLKVMNENGETKEAFKEIEATQISEDEQAIRNLLSTRNVSAFAKMIPNASPATRETIVKCAIELNVTDPGFVALIEKYCQVDIIKAITLQRQAEK